MFVVSVIMIVICNFFQYTVNVLLCWLIVSADISFSSSRIVFKHSSNSSLKYENKKRRLHLEIEKNSTFFSSDIYLYRSVYIGIRKCICLPTYLHAKYKKLKDGMT